ncbi:MAG: preprotein translocase subunit YajC [Bacteroidota bacterium]
MLFWFLAAPAQSTANAAAPQSANLFVSLFPFILLFGFMWLLIIRPQKKQQEAHRRMLAALKKGDRVVTAGGLVGEVTEIDDDELRVRIADKVEARFVKNAVTRVIKG